MVHLIARRSGGDRGVLAQSLRGEAENGEWFELDVADVAVFKRRRFM
jgi:hypothetical protein